MKIHSVLDAWLVRGATAATLLFATLLMSAGGALASEGVNKGATYVGQEACGQCHSLADSHYAGTTHAKVFKNPKNDLEGKVCEACHGPGSNHLEDATDRDALIGFTREWGSAVEKQQGQCLQCHEGGQRIDWPDSVHQVNNLSCSDCHNPMAKFSQTGLLKKPSISETCFTCHQEKRAEFSRRSHMPLLEGKISCDDCHNPHGSTTRPLLKRASIAETCFQCHSEKRGPFLFEHPPVRQGDQCLNCHLPHGSNQEKLLITARPMLCQQCHSQSTGHDNVGIANLNNVANAQANVIGLPPVPGSNAVPEQIVARSCVDCHTQIHGSNSPAGPRWHR